MELFKAALFVALMLATQLAQALSSPATVPAFLWSPHGYGTSHHTVKGVVNYRTISPKELAKLVLSEGSWSNILCSREKHLHGVNFVLVFIGKKFKTSDISRSISDPSLVDLLKLSFSTSNISIAFPYVTVSDEREKLENTLVSGFAENCGHDLGVDQIVYLDSCSVDSKDVMTLGGLSSLHEYLRSRMESIIKVKADMIVFCSEGLDELTNSQSEGELLSGLVSFLNQLGATYSVLYASDPYSLPLYTSYPALERFLSEDALGNGSANSKYCDGVCQIKSSLLEGVFVAIVLLIILISGLCCMMGIETPSRFETPQES
uniref:DNA-directed RNA polymerase subunit beta n=1 Tax=Anthurium amnicola TaxID=1678845 RepID=A0A1D1YYL2_9ARAE